MHSLLPLFRVRTEAHSETFDICPVSFQGLWRFTRGSSRVNSVHDHRILTQRRATSAEQNVTKYQTISPWIMSLCLLREGMPRVLHPADGRLFCSYGGIIVLLQKPRLKRCHCPCRYWALESARYASRLPGATLKCIRYQIFGFLFFTLPR